MHAAAFDPGLELRVFDNHRQQLGDVHGLALDAFGAALQAGEGQQRFDQGVHAFGFMFDAFEHFQARGVLAQQADSRLHACQRRAQFMGNVVQQMLLGLHQYLELIGHAVAVFGQVDDFIAALAHGGLDPGFEAPLGHIAHGPAQMGQGPGQVVRHVAAEQSAHQRADQQRDLVPGPVRDVAGGVGGPDRKRQALLAGDRSFIGRLRNRRPRDQAPVAVIDADVLIRRTFPDREELACGVDPELLQ